MNKKLKIGIIIAVIVVVGALAALFSNPDLFEGSSFKKFKIPQDGSASGPASALTGQAKPQGSGSKASGPAPVSTRQAGPR